MGEPLIKASATGDIPRGSTIKFTVDNMPPGSTIRKWIFEGTRRVKVTRPKGEDQTNWQKSWEGKIVSSGNIAVRYETKIEIVVNPKKTKWKVTPWNKNPRVELAINVVPRTGKDWSSTVVEQPEKPTSQIKGNKPLIPPIQFRDLGKHEGEIKSDDPLTETIDSGPNRGYVYVTALENCTLESRCYINDDLQDSNSAFSAAQDGCLHFTADGSQQDRVAKDWKKYFNIQGGKIVATNEPGFFKDYNIQSYSAQFPRITYDRLLEFTCRHEYRGQLHSHRANFKKAAIALDPKAYAESLIAKPNEGVDFKSLVNKRINLIIEAGHTHQIIDEVETKNSGKLKYDTASGQMLMVNQDDAGNIAGGVWDPTNNRSFPDSTNA
jgi:hypothetical protein